mmetsp:Transcript_53209/g.129215  ORF Transcript_53209/g.129215 Transcript_53209/m.129215 type:complete len:92 (-) Transcript_53209:267-542(-)
MYRPSLWTDRRSLEHSYKRAPWLSIDQRVVFVCVCDRSINSETKVVEYNRILIDNIQGRPINRRQQHNNTVLAMTSLRWVCLCGGDVCEML